MEHLIMVVHVLIALAIIGLVLVQQGKGADMGASFGGGGSQTLFGGRGSGNALTHATAIFAALFFATSFALAVVAKNKALDAGRINLPVPAAMEMPVGVSSGSVDEIPTVEQNAAPAAGDLPAEANEIPVEQPSQ
jgi:preprotein translocase subunit SecG